jgi:hypothetical protein
MVELAASGDADQVEARLPEAPDAHGLQLFARVDHAAGACKADVELEADVLLTLGNARVGAPDAGRPPRRHRAAAADARRYAFDGHQQTLERQTAVLSALAAAAAG